MPIYYAHDDTNGVLCVDSMPYLTDVADLAETDPDTIYFVHPTPPELVMPYLDDEQEIAVYNLVCEIANEAALTRWSPSTARIVEAMRDRGLIGASGSTEAV